MSSADIIIIDRSVYKGHSMRSVLFVLGGVYMPYRPRTPCRHSGCVKLIDSGKYCSEHLPMHPEVIRSASKRGYNYKWRKKRIQFLKKHPLCERCKADGKYTEATVVDHIIPHRGDEKLMWDENNWQALCKPCHDKKTGCEDRTPTYRY